MFCLGFGAMEAEPSCVILDARSKDVNKAPFPIVNVIAEAPTTAGAESLRARLDALRAEMSK